MAAPPSMRYGWRRYAGNLFSDGLFETAMIGAWNESNLCALIPNLKLDYVGMLLCAMAYAEPDCFPEALHTAVDFFLSDRIITLTKSVWLDGGGSRKKGEQRLRCFKITSPSVAL